jgi:hypothetical protein
MELVPKAEFSIVTRANKAWIPELIAAARVYLKECADPKHSFSETQRPKLSHLLRVKRDSQIVQRSNVISGYIDTDTLPCRFCF